MEDATTKIREALSKFQPAEVAVLQGDEVTRTVKIQKGGQRWSSAASVLTKLPWSSLHFLGRAGDVIHVVESAPDPEAGAGELEDLGAGTGRALLSAADFALVARTITHSQTAALAAREKESGAALAAVISVMREMATAVQLMSQMYRHQLDVARELVGPAGAAPTPQSSKLLELIAPQLIAQVFKPDAVTPPPVPPATPPNGKPPS